MLYLIECNLEISHCSDMQVTKIVSLFLLIGTA